MKRDWELVRKILIAVEEIQGHNQHVDGTSIPGYDAPLVSYHIYLLKEAGLLEATCATFLSEPRQCHAFELTWEGHEFLDQIRPQSIWNKTVSLVREKGLDLSFSTIKAAAAAVAKSLITF
ncbi:DUF2513 domain-containing protein [Pseudomonas sp. R1-18]|uniref:DUF2513 domain-containing protein n=1 Tax=Pseudomonas sp. R1-18 TaxID=1632772 RepID=UPI003DA89734